MLLINQRPNRLLGLSVGWPVSKEVVQSSMSKQARWVGVACVDWDNPTLVASAFYPDDVPQDWYLTYYANFIMACVLSPAKWRSASMEQIQDWLEQTQDNFWFYLLCETPEQVEMAQSRAAAFGNKFAGLVLSAALSKEAVSSELPMLNRGQEVFDYDYADLRQAKAQLIAWLSSESAQDHALVLMSASCAAEAHNVQTLLDLLGGTH